MPLALEVSPFSLAERTAFVGRETEGSAIRAAIDRARTGHGSIVMLGGGAGVGKSRLAIEMAEYASQVGFRCSAGHCYERDEPFPYLPKPLELPAVQQRGYLFQSVSEALARVAGIRFQLLVLEDLHWAGESKLALLTHLARRVAQLPAVIIGTYRSRYSNDNPALVRTLEELIRMGVRPQKLSGLSKAAVGQMLQGLGRREAPENCLSLIFEESQGYPFFVEEVYRHLVEEGKIFDPAGQIRKEIKLDEIDVPDNVRLIISRRMERLDENEKRVLAAAAVIGRGFSFQLLTEISQIDVDQLFNVIEKAQGMGIVVPS